MMGTTTTVCCLTRHLFLGADQLLKTDLLYSLQALMTVGNVSIFRIRRSCALDTRLYEMVGTMMVRRLARL